MEKTVLTPNQRAVLESLAQEKYITETFFLSGGTALSAFYFKHRISEDFDLFSEKVYEAKKVAIWVQKAAKNLKVQKAEQQKLTGQDVYYFSFVRIVNRFLSEELVLVSHTTFALDVFSFICLY